MQAIHCAACVGAIDVLEYLIKNFGCDLSTVYRHFIPNYVHIAHPLYQLTKKVLNHINGPKHVK